MRLPRIISLAVITALSFSLSGRGTYAQMSNQAPGGNPGMGMILFPVQRGADGQQYIITRAGYKVAVPGIGIDPSATQLAAFQDAQNNFYYINKNGQPTPVSAQQMQSVMGQIQQQQMMRQGGVSQYQAMPGQAGMSQYPQAMPYGGQPPGYSPQSAAPAAAAAPAAVPQQSSNNGSSGNSAMMSGLAAAGGAAMGAGLVNMMNNNNNDQYGGYGYGGTPYGQPIYKAPTGQYYYNNPATGAQSYVTPTASTSAYYNQYEQQQQEKDAAVSKAYATNQANQQQQQQEKDAAATKAYANNNASQEKQMTTQEAQAAQSKEGQESGRRRFGRGKSEESQGGGQAAAAAEQSSGRRRRFGRGQSDQVQGGQTAGAAAQADKNGQGSRRFRREGEGELGGADGGRFDR